MDKQQAVEDFLKALRISLNYIFLYSGEHAAFRSSVTSLQKRFDELSVFLDPVYIGFSPDALTMDCVTYHKSSVYKELAGIFHKRKIKSIEIRRGVTQEELRLFLSKAATPARDVILAGGLKRLLPEGLSHVAVEDLDYSSLLNDSGEEVRDVWAYLLRDSLAKNNLNQAMELAANFPSVMSKIKVRDLLGNEELLKELYRFVSFMKRSGAAGAQDLNKHVLKRVMRDASQVNEQEIGRLKEFFVDMSDEDLAKSFAENMTVDDIDEQSFVLFSRLCKKDTSAHLSRLLEDELAKEGPAQQQLRRRLREMFSSPDKAEQVPETYRRFAGLIFKESPLQEQFEPGDERESYANILVNLFVLEKDGERLKLIADRVIASWQSYAGNLQFLKVLLKELREKRRTGASPLKLDNHVTAFLEDRLWESRPDSAEISELILESARGRDFYLSRFFDDSAVTPEALKVFFRLFPDGRDSFLECFKRRGDDLELVSAITGSLAACHPAMALDVLKGMFLSSGDMVKSEALKAMAGLPIDDQPFLLDSIAGASSFIKRETLSVLSRDRGALGKALEAMLRMPNHWGRKNEELLENMAVVEEMGLRASLPMLEELCRSSFLWARPVRNRAHSIVKKWKQ